MSLPMLRDLAAIQAKSGGNAVAPRGRTTRPVRGSMNGTESRYAAHLERRRLRGEIIGFWFEPIKLRLADKTWYSPDFLVMAADGTLEFHETKGGYVRDDALVKVKVVAEVYWLFRILLVREKPRNVWKVTEVGR